MTGKINSFFKIRIGLVCLFSSLYINGWGQDRLPVTLKSSRPCILPEETETYRQPQEPLFLNNSMPKAFKNTQENIIIDTAHVLVPFFEKLRVRKKPVRVVHIGDSHIRGHVLPLVVRHNFERDFGSRAVYADTVTYFSSGLARETGEPGPVYHIIGINGATCTNFTNAMQVSEIAALNPDLIIVSFGTNESHGKGYTPSVHEKQMDDLLERLREECSDAVFLLTTPPGSYVRYRRRKSMNTRTPLVAKTIREYALKRGYAVWDMYNIVGGRERACLNWVNGNYMVHDRVHYTAAGYTLQGNLLYEALIKAYNNYVSN